MFQTAIVASDAISWSTMPVQIQVHHSFPGDRKAVVALLLQALDSWHILERICSLLLGTNEIEIFPRRSVVHGRSDFESRSALNMNFVRGLTGTGFWCAISSDNCVGFSILQAMCSVSTASSLRLPLISGYSALR
jgi:hypothetical protein